MSELISCVVMSTRKQHTDLGARLREAFHRSGMTRFALSKKSGVGYATVHRFIGEDRDVMLSTASRVFDADDGPCGRGAHSLKARSRRGVAS